MSIKTKKVFCPRGLTVTVPTVLPFGRDTRNNESFLLFQISIRAFFSFVKLGFPAGSAMSFCVGDWKNSGIVPHLLDFMSPNFLFSSKSASRKYCSNLRSFYYNVARGRRRLSSCPAAVLSAQEVQSLALVHLVLLEENGSSKVDSPLFHISLLGSFFCYFKYPLDIFSLVKL